MATGVNYWSPYEPSYKVSQSVWGGEQESSSEEGGGGVTWDTRDMEVKGLLISVPDLLTYQDRKLSQRMAELQERKRSLQALLSVRLTELRHICLQEAELTGAVPSDFPLEAGEKLPYVRRRGRTFHHGTRMFTSEEDDFQRSKPKKTIFSGALRKHGDSEHNSHHGKRTVHRGCHTDDSVRSESSSTSDSTGHDNDDGVSQCQPSMVSAGSLVKGFFHNKTTRNSLHRSDHLKTLQTLRLPPLAPPPRSQDSMSSGPSDPGTAGATAARHSNSSDVLLDDVATLEEGWRINAVDQQARINNGPDEGGAKGAGRGRGRRRGRGGYSEVLLDCVWGKQQQHLQRQQPITLQHQPLFNSCSAKHTPIAPPTYRGHQGDQRRIKVTRTRSCGPFFPAQQSQTDSQNLPLSVIQPDPHPHLLPPRPPQLPLNQEAQLEEATRSLHKALALEGLRDWYLRNTIGSTHQNQANGKLSSGVASGLVAKWNRGVKGQADGDGALQINRTSHMVIHQSAYQMEKSHHHAVPRHKQMLVHSATFHEQPLQDRSLDVSLYHDSFIPQKQEVPLRDQTMDQPSPGTLV